MPRVVVTAQVEDLVKWEEGFRTHGDLFRSQTVSEPIGIVTNELRRFGHPARASELATEMKSYAKTLPGSVFVVDRRRDADRLENGHQGSIEA